MGNIKGILYAIVSSATFGLIPLFSIPLIHSGLDSPSILFYRFGFSALIIGAIALVAGKKLRISWRDLALFAYLGVLYAATSLWLLKSYSLIPSGVATTIHFLYPLVVTLIMVVLFHKRRSLWLLVAGLVSLFGVGLLSWSKGGESAAEIRGVLMVLITVVTYAAYIVSVNKTRAREMEPLVVTFYVLTIGTSIFFVYAMFDHGVEMLHTGREWLNALLLALLPTVLSNFTLVMAVKKIGSTMTSILGSMEPLTAMMVGVFYFGEVFSSRSAVGMCLIVASVIIVVLLNRGAKSDS